MKLRRELTRAQKLVEKPGPACFKASVLTRLAGKYRELDDPVAASEVLDQALTFAESVEVKNPLFRAEVLIEIAGQYRPPEPPPAEPEPESEATPETNE